MEVIGRPALLDQRAAGLDSPGGRFHPVTLSTIHDPDVCLCTHTHAGSFVGVKVAGGDKH